MHQKNKPDLIIADIRMPEISGLELLRLAKEWHEGCAFILLSGYSDFTYAQQAVSLGAFEYCLKPLKPEQARSVLKRAADMLRKNLDAAEESPIENERFAALLKYIDANYKKPLQQKELCERFGLHPSYCSRLFASKLGHGFAEHLTAIRMQEAKRLLLQGEYSVADVAELCGYSDYYYFTKVFTKSFGISPSKTKKVAQHEKH